MHLRGTPRDIRLLNRLSSYPILSDLVGSPESDSRWTMSQGFKPGKTDGTELNPKLAWWTEEHLFLDAKNKLDFVVNNDECVPVGNRFSTLHRLPDAQVFSGPMILIAQGFTKIAFCEFDVLFRSSLQSIGGNATERHNLVFLCAYLRSKLAKYFLFHTTAYWGVERKKVLESELRQLPFILPDHRVSVANSSKIVGEVCSIFDKAVAKINFENLADHSEIIRKADSAIEPLIFEYFDCDEHEQSLVHDTCEVVEPSATPTSLDNDIPSLRLPSQAQREVYGNTICKVLNGWGGLSSISISVRSVASPATGLGIVVLSQHTQRESDAPATDEIANEKVIEQLGILRNKMRRDNGMRTFMRGVTIFDGKTAYIIKPLSLRFWTKTAALNDADSLAAAILNSKRATSS